MPVFLRWFLRLGLTNPITVRLVQNGSRRVRHMYIRSAYLAVLIVALMWLLLKDTSGALSYRTLASAASSAFTSIAYLQILLICVLAPVFLGGAIAQEASPRTWEVILTTPLSAGQIVLGNLFGRLFFVLALMAASLPLSALTQYFGGVPGRSIFASYAIAGCTALVVGAVAISLAVSRIAGRRAFFAFYVGVISYLFVTWALDQYLRASGQGAVNGSGVTIMTALNPFLTLTALLNASTYPTAPPGTGSGLRAWLLESPVQTFCVGSSLLSLAFMTAATFTIRAGGLQTLAQLGKTGGIPWYRRVLGLGASGAEFRPPRHVWTNPIAWREAAARNATLGRILARWSFVILGLLLAMVLLVGFHRGSLDSGTFRLALSAAAWGESAVIALVAINMAGTAISREREDGTLDILLTTPVTAGAYLTGKLRGLIAYLLPMLAVPVLTLGLAGAYVAAGGLGREGGVMIKHTVGSGAVEIPAVVPEAGLIAMFTLIAFTAFCVMVGLNWSLRSKGTIGSVVVSVGVVGVVTAILGLCAWQAGAGIPVVGPAVSALSPAALVHALVNPEIALRETVAGNSGLTAARVGLVIGGLLAAGMYALACYGIHAHMTRTFDMTVRRLAGTR